MTELNRSISAVEGGLVGFRGGITAGMSLSGQVGLYMTVELGMMSRNMSSSWCTHGAHMVTEIKEYDVRAYRYSMVALR